MASYLLQEDGVSKFILEEGSGFILLEESTVTGIPIASDTAQVAHDKLIALGYSADEATRLQNQWTHES